MPTVHSTTCPLDCPDTCSLAVTVEDGRIAEIAAGDSHPTTGGFICSKVRRFDRRVYHPDRLLYPMRRAGPKGEGAFQRISWDDAIAEVNGRFRDIVDEWGGEAILPYNYGGSNGILTDGFVDDLYFARLGASRNQKTLCAVPTTVVATGMYGKMPGVAYQDFPEAKCIIIWGMNPKASSVHLVPFLREAKRNGAFIVTIDPRRNFSSNEVDLHLPVLPGADLPLALGMIRLWDRGGLLDEAFLREHATNIETLRERADEWSLERVAGVTGLNQSDMELLADRYAVASPALIRTGWGLERNRNGGQAIAAILAIPALLGKFGVRGGGYTMSNNGAIRSRLGEALGIAEGNTRMLNQSQLGRTLNETVDPPIKGLFVYNCNPVVTAPDQNAVVRGMSREDLFTVVFEQVHTDSAAYADILLPATTFLEHDDVRVSYGTYVVGGVKSVIPACGEARSNPEVFAALGRDMGWDDDAFHWNPAEYVRKVAASLTLEEKPADGDVLEAGKPLHVEYPKETPVQFESVWPRTPGGKINLTPLELGDAPYTFELMEDLRHPLVLLSPSTSRLVSSTFGEFNYDELSVTVHPKDAAPRGIGEGDEVRVFNDIGEVRCRAEVRSSIRPGVVSMPKGAWRKSSLNGSTSTALCPAHVNVVGGGACYNDARVEVARAG